MCKERKNGKYDKEGYDKRGYDRDGFNRDGYDHEEALKQVEDKTDFIDNIKVENKDKIFMLQRKIKEKQIAISDLTNRELDELIALYKEQIEEKKFKLKQYRMKILN